MSCPVSESIPYAFNKRCIETDTGWNRLLIAAFKEIQEYDTYQQFKVNAITEIKGVLYIDWCMKGTADTYTEAVIEQIINEAQNKSKYICEDCGESGETFESNGWWYTRCKKHKEEIDNGI
jgi:hypothetical protein